MSSEFKELNLDRTRLKECVEEYWEVNNLQGGAYSEEAAFRHRVKYVQDGCDVLVEFIFIRNGTTTIHTKIGKHYDKGEQLALYLKDKLVEDSRKSVAVSVKGINQETFEFLIESLQELNREDAEVAEISVVVNAEDQAKKAVRATSKYNDSLTLTHYRTKNTLLIQGKPLYTYAQVTYFLANFTDLNGFIAIVSKGEEDPNSIEIDKDSVETELKAVLPSAYTEVGEGILKMLRTSFMLKDISIPLPDYSCYVFPALRALEAVMRRLLFNAGYSIQNDNENSFRGIFSRDVNGNFSVSSNFRMELGNNKICEALDHCYDYFVQQRHSLFHANDFTDSSRFISTKEHANQVIETIVNKIDTAYRITT